MIVVIGGLVTCLQEPQYDHLYGLWFKEQGQVNAFTTHGIHVPLWLPIIYIAYITGAARFGIGIRLTTVRRCAG